MHSVDKKPMFLQKIHNIHIVLNTILVQCRIVENNYIHEILNKT